MPFAPAATLLEKCLQQLLLHLIVQISKGALEAGVMSPEQSMATGQQHAAIRSRSDRSIALTESKPDKSLVQIPSFPVVVSHHARRHEAAQAGVGDFISCPDCLVSSRSKFKLKRGRS